MATKTKNKKKSSKKSAPASGVMVKYGQHLGKEGTGVIPHTGMEPEAHLRETILAHSASINRSRWELGAALWKVEENDIWRDCWGYPEYEDYIRAECQMVKRTAQYLTAMYHYFAVQIMENIKAELEREQIKALEEAESLPQKERDVRIKELEAELAQALEKAAERQGEIIEAVKQMGWTKGKSLVGVVDLDNAEVWIEKAGELSSAELEREAKVELNRRKGVTEPEQGERMTVVTFRFTDDQMEEVENSIEKAKKIAKSEKRSHLISLVCLDFNASNVGQEASGHPSFGSYLNKIGAQFGVWLIAVDKESGNIVHNQELFDSVKCQEGDDKK